MENTKRILIPVDFSVKSLAPLSEAIRRSEGYQLDIILIHGIHLPDSITELLFFRKGNLIEELQGDEFTNACDLIKNKYQSLIRSMYVDIIISDNQSYFTRYVKANRIDEIYWSEDIEMEYTNKRSFDILPLLQKEKEVRVTALNIFDRAFSKLAFTNQMADLFITNSKGHA